MPTADVIVVGLGAMGSAACRQLAERGVSVIGIDRYAPPHVWGSTHGDTRITRLAIGEGREYVPLARRSHELWRELEATTGADVLTQPGIVILAHPTSTFLNETRAAALEYGIAHRELTNGELRSAFPMFAVDDRTVAYHEPEAGYLRPERAVAAQLALAAGSGAELRLGEHVEHWSASARGVTVTTPANTYTAGQLLLCAGAWIGDLFPEGRDLFAVYRQLLFWFPIRERYPELRDMPAFVWDVGGDQQGFVHLDGFYGFPAIDGPGGGVKVASESYEHTTRPDGRQHPASRAEVERCTAGASRPTALAGRRAAADGLLPVHEHAREPFRDRPSPRARNGAHRLRLLGPRFQALTGDRGGRRPVADGAHAGYRAWRVQLRPRAAGRAITPVCRPSARRTGCRTFPTRGGNPGRRARSRQGRGKPRSTERQGAPRKVRAMDTTHTFPLPVDVPLAAADSSPPSPPPPALIWPGCDEYDTARQAWNLHADQRPAASAWRATRRGRPGRHGVRPRRTASRSRRRAPGI